MKNIAIYFGHDCSLAMHDTNRKDIYAVELERLSGEKHHLITVDKEMFSDGRKGQVEKASKYLQLAFDSIMDTHYEPSEDRSVANIYVKLMMNNRQTEAFFKEVLDEMNIDYKRLVVCDESDSHHSLHLYSAFITSPFEDCFSITWDVAGDDDCTVMTEIIDGKEIDSRSLNKSYGNMYNYAAQACSSLENTKNMLDLAGKLMGLSAYGKVTDRGAIWETEKTIDFFERRSRVVQSAEKTKRGAFNQVFSGWQPWEPIDKRVLLNRKIRAADSETGGAIALDFSEWSHRSRWNKFWLKDKEEYDFAWAAQEFLERALIRLVSNNMEKIMSAGGNLLLSGGCALNVLCNQRIKKEFPHLNIYVPPNPGDGGNSVGLLAKKLMQDRVMNYKDYHSTSIKGIKVTDRHKFEEYFPDAQQVGLSDIVEILKSGKIVGLIQDNCEFGPRALGFRSILCDATYPHMKDTLNAKVKKREWYRPFAPVCRLEDAPKYFDSPNFRNTEHMSYTVEVKEEYREELSSITHVDGTARLQTVTSFTNGLLYAILTLMNGVLLNTSFNVNRKPILNTLEDAKNILDNTDLDCICYLDDEGRLWRTTLNEDSIDNRSTFRN